MTLTMTSFHWHSLMSIDIHWHSLTCIDVHWYSLTFIDVHWRSLMYTGVHWCTLMFIDVHWCTLMLIDVHWHWLMYTDAYWCLLTFIDVHWRSLMFIDVHWRSLMLIGAHFFNTRHYWYLDIHIWVWIYCCYWWLSRTFIGILLECGLKYLTPHNEINYLPMLWYCSGSPWFQRATPIAKKTLLWEGSVVYFRNTLQNIQSKPKQFKHIWWMTTANCLSMVLVSYSYCQYF